jgi:serine/threonine protein kinase
LKLHTPCPSMAPQLEEAGEAMGAHCRVVVPWYQETKPLEDPDAIKMLQRGQKLLDAVEKSDFCSTLDARKYPLFDPSELVLGPKLGLGGFGIVLEVEEIVLHLKSLAAASIESTTEDENDEFYDEFDPAVLDHTDFADVMQARSFMESNVRRKQVTRLHGQEVEGAARYALKRLRSDLTDVLRARGAIDLAMEAKFLARLSHPNIVKMRGYASGSSLRPDFFIVLDRLYEILNRRIKDWKYALRIHASEKLWQTLWRRDRKKGSLQNVAHDIMLERLVISYDLAAAFSYMHQNRYVWIGSPCH